MKIKIIRWFINLSLALLCLQLFSCSVAYNSIQYQKSEGNLLAKTRISAENKKMENNKVFIHYRDTVFQLTKLNINRSISGQSKSISGDIVPVNSHYSEVYEVLEKKPKGKDISLRRIAGPNAAYIGQTHFFVDSITLSDRNIKVHEEDLQGVTSYYQSKTRLYILVFLGLLFGGLIVMVAVAFSQGFS